MERNGGSGSLGARPSVPDRLLGVREAAELLSVKPATLYTWASDRRIPTVKLGRALRFRLSTLQKLITKSERPALL